MQLQKSLTCSFATLRLVGSQLVTRGVIDSQFVGSELRTRYLAIIDSQLINFRLTTHCASLCEDVKVKSSFSLVIGKFAKLDQNDE